MIQKIKFLFKSRLNRSNFIFGQVFQIILFISWSFLSSYLADNFGWSDNVLWQTIILDILLFSIWGLGSSIILRRCHDLEWNKFGSIVLSFIFGCPIIFGSILSLILAFSKGSDTANAYGEPDNKKFFRAIFNL